MRYKHPVISQEAIETIERVLSRGTLSSFRATADGHSGGYHVRALEESFCAYFGTRYAVAMNSATNCLFAAMVACGIGRDDTVVATPYSFSSSASSALMVGAYPLFADIDEDTFGIYPQSVAKLIAGAKAIVPVHQFGHPVDMDALHITGQDVKIIEDAAQAIGAKYRGKYVGTLGDCGIFSFNQAKHISAGEGGILITNDDYIARVARAMRNSGEVADPELGMVGYNFRMCEIEAILALDQFIKLETNLEWRRELAECMTRGLLGIDGLIPPIVRAGCTHSFYQYAIKVNKELLGMTRDKLAEGMNNLGLTATKGYVMPLYRLPIYQNRMNWKDTCCEVAERMWQEELITIEWLRPPMKVKDVERIVNNIKELILANGNSSTR
jgi:dTDP-4-amino-4,6-dideoxygalactose transaminase